MKSRTALIVSSALCLVGIAVFGCSSSSDAAAAASNGDCPSAGSKACPNDTAIAQTDVDQCTKLKADAKCGSKYVAVLKCAGNNVKCDSGGKSDSTAITAACKTEQNDYVSCLTASPADAGGD